MWGRADRAGTVDVTKTEATAVTQPAEPRIRTISPDCNTAIRHSSRVRNIKSLSREVLINQDLAVSTMDKIAALIFRSIQQFVGS